MMLTTPLYSEVGGVRLLTDLLSRVTLRKMSASFRVLAVMTACLLISSGIARADALDNSVKETTAKPQKVRLAAVLALSKSKDPRAVYAVTNTLRHDEDHNIRRIAAIALEKMIDHTTADDARELALDALERASKQDRDLKVMETSARVFKTLATLRGGKNSPNGNKPAVFVNIDAAVDQSKKAPKDAPDRLAKIVRKSIERTGYSTSWPGGLPSSKDLSKSKSQAYIVASTVKKIEITKGGKQTTIACTVAIRVSPWSGKDGGEKWEANKSASASGSAKAMTGNSEHAISSGMRDCIDAVTEDVTNRQVVPFLKRVAQAGS
jgi:hypothetical protein